MVLLNLINQDYCPVKFTEGGVDDFDKPESFAELICGLTELFSTGDINIDLVTAFLASYDVRTEDWNDFVTFNKNGYSRNLIYQGGEKFNIILACWDTNQASSIHDHSDSHCFMKMLDGSLTETVYGIDQHSWSLETKRKYLLQKSAVAYIRGSFGLHRISNDSNKRRAVSLHVYSPPFQTYHQVDESSGRPVQCKSTYSTRFQKQFIHSNPSICPVDDKVMFCEGKIEQFKVPKTMDDVIEGLLNFFSTNDVNINQVKAFMESYQADSSDWKQYAVFDKYKYTRNLIHEGNGKFNLLLLCWNKNQKSTIHDHSDSHCFMKMLDGSLTEILYNWPTEEEKKSGATMEPVRNIRLKTGSVAYINGKRSFDG